MRCAQCHAENAIENLFCINCGTALGRACPRCAHANPSEARFCGRCSAPLARDTEPYADPLLATRSAVEGERRLVTVLFADLSGSTALIESLDPEEAIKRLAPALAAMKEAVRRFEGSVNKVQGDGIMALFGAPLPQEDHAVRACCAALAMQVAVAALGDASLSIRIGLHTGEVLARNVSNDLSTDYDAIGITVHIASRMEQMAERGSILMTGATRQAAQNFIETTALGAQPVKGLTNAVEVFRLIGLKRGPASQRFRGERSLSHFIGRSPELAYLEAALDAAAEGDPRIVGVVGDAGVGKSRLCFEFAEACRRRGFRVFEARALAHSRSTPFEPIIDLLRDYFRLAPGEPAETARSKIAVRLQAREAGDDADIALMCDFLGVGDGGAAAGAVDAAARRDRLLNIVRRLVRSGTVQGAAVVLIEDLHWLDEGSAAFLEAMADALVGSHALFVVNFRPGYVAPWMTRSYYDQLPLRPLRSAAADELLRSLLGGDDSVADLSKQIGERAGGNPFFIEEQVRALEESGCLAGQRGAYRLQRQPERHIMPATVQAIVSARIDRRPEPERTVLHAAAVIGREFRTDLLQRIVGLPEPTIQQALQRLASAELVYEQGPANVGAYAFKHPLTQEVAYRSQLTDNRRALHARIAEDLEKTLPDAGGGQAGFVAYHWEEAGNPAQAAQWNVKAAMWHGTRDPAQALEAWKRVRALIKAGPAEGPMRYMLLMACGQIVNFAWRMGVTAQDAEKYFDEAIELARELGDMRAATLITAAYGRLLGATGSADDYVSKVREALALLQLPRDRSLQVVLTTVLCHAYRMAGLLNEALAANDAALAGVGEIAAVDAQTLGFDPAVWIKGMRAQTLVWMGRFDEARPIIDDLLAADDQKVDALHRMIGHACSIDIAWATGAADDATRNAAEMTQLAERSGNPYLLVYAKGYSGLALAIGGDGVGAIARLREAIGLARQKRAGLENEPRMLCDLAATLLQTGDRGEAAKVAREALEIARARGARVPTLLAEQIAARADMPEAQAAGLRPLIVEAGLRIGLAS